MVLSTTQCVRQESVKSSPTPPRCREATPHCIGVEGSDFRRRTRTPSPHRALSRVCLTATLALVIVDMGGCATIVRGTTEPVTLATMGKTSVPTADARLLSPYTPDRRTRPESGDWVERPFVAYRGDLPYIFVCYAHEDSDTVFPEISWLHDQGVKIWYDEGISPGLEWTEALANAIQGSSKVLFFVTPHSVTSENCRRELNFAQEEGHDVVAVHLADTEIPPGLRLSLNNRQAILRRELSDDRYRQELMQVAQTAVADPVEPDPQPSAAKSSGRWTGLALTKTRRVSHPWVWGSVGFLVVVLAASSVLFADRLTLWWAYNAPEWLGRSVTQQIRFTETTDGVRIAYATSGEGPVLVLVVGWFTHLERGPIYDTPDIVNALSSGHLLVRYDGRGFGMSDRDVSDFSLAARVRDLEAIVEAVGAEKGPHSSGLKRK